MDDSRELEIVDRSISFAGADGHDITGPRAKLEENMQWLIDQKIEVGELSIEEGMGAFKMLMGYLNAVETVEQKQIERMRFAPY